MSEKDISGKKETLCLLAFTPHFPFTNLKRKRGAIRIQYSSQSHEELRYQVSGRAGNIEALWCWAAKKQVDFFHCDANWCSALTSSSVCLCSGVRFQRRKLKRSTLASVYVPSDCDHQGNSGQECRSEQTNKQTTTKTQMSNTLVWGKQFQQRHHIASGSEWEVRKYIQYMKPYPFNKSVQREKKWTGSVWVRGRKAFSCVGLPLRYGALEHICNPRDIGDKNKGSWWSELQKKVGGTGVRSMGGELNFEK